MSEVSLVMRITANTNNIMETKMEKKDSHSVISAFEPSERLPQDAGGFGIAPNVIHLANEERFTTENFSEPLTTYAVGYRDPSDIMGVLDFLAPPVEVGRRFEFKKADNAQEFFSETDDVRAIGGDFKLVESKGSTVNEKTLNKGLSIRLDRDEHPDIERAATQQTGRLLRRLYRNELRRGIALASAAATNSAMTWDATAGKDPDKDIMDMLVAAGDASGVDPNRVLFGQTAWQKRFLSTGAQNTAAGFAGRNQSPEEVAALLGLDRIMVSRQRYQSSASAKSQIVANLVLAFYAEDDVTTEDPTNFKRFWTPCEGGTKYRVYREDRAKVVIISVEHYSNIVGTSSLGVRKLTVS